MTEKRLRADVLLSSKEPAESCSFTQWLFLCFIKNIPPHTRAVWGKAPTMLEKQRKIILLPVVHQMAIKNKSQKTNKPGGVRYLKLQKRSMKTVEKHWLGEVGIHINVFSCIGFIINPLTCTCYIIAAGKALLTLWDILWVIWSDLKLKWEKETVFYLLTNITLDYVLEPA